MCIFDFGGGGGGSGGAPRSAFTPEEAAERRRRILYREDDNDRSKTGPGTTVGGRSTKVDVSPDYDSVFGRMNDQFKSSQPDEFNPFH